MGARARGAHLAAIVVVAAIVCASGARAEGWRRYHNPRFGTSADVPRDWTMGDAPENGDGRVFASPDKQSEIVVFGGSLLTDANAEIAERLAPGEGETVTYRKRGENWLVVSGTKGDRIFYRKSLLSCGGTIWNNVSIDYPASQKAALDRLVTRVSRSLRPDPACGETKRRRRGE